MERELELKLVTFTFEDGSQRELRGEELETWIGICYSHSDYLLPGNPTMVIGSMLNGLIWGFVPPEAVTERG